MQRIQLPIPITETTTYETHNIVSIVIVFVVDDDDNTTTCMHSQVMYNIVFITMWCIVISLE